MLFQLVQTKFFKSELFVFAGSWSRDQLMQKVFKLGVFFIMNCFFHFNIFEAQNSTHNTVDHEEFLALTRFVVPKY